MTPAYSFRDSISLLQFKISSEDSLMGKPTSGNNTISGQLCILKYSSDVRRVCIRWGSDLSFKHWLMESRLRLKAGNPPSGKDARFGQSFGKM